MSNRKKRQQHAEAGSHRGPKKKAKLSSGPKGAQRRNTLIESEKKPGERSKKKNGATAKTRGEAREVVTSPKVSGMERKR